MRPLPLPRPLASAAHPLVRRVRRLRAGARERREEGLFLVEGPRGLDAALAAGAPVVWVLVAAKHSRAREFRPLLERLLESGVPVCPVRSALLDRIAPTATSTGLLAACRLPSTADDPRPLWEAPGDRWLAVTCGVQDPGNLGAIVRCAAAFDVDALVAVGGADPWHPRAVRASGGGVHSLSIARTGEAEAVAEALSRHRFRRLAAVPRGGRDPARVDFRGRVALLLGAETAGLPAVLARGAELVTIPITAVESLSVSSAAAILMAIGSRARR